ncbi:hypothetical protein ACFL1X_12470 [Candidatus Hydrogenedentota bacterium]
MITKICPECNVQFSYEPPVGFPDKRKYCPDCSAGKKAEWEAKQNQTAQNQQIPQQAPVQQGNVTAQVAKHDVVISRTEKPHSYEFGMPGARHKIYYGDVQELKEQIDELTAAGLFIPSSNIND